MGRLSAALGFALALGGCSGEQAYSAGQNWQRNQCARLPDKAEYDRCMADAGRSYDSYKREKDGAQR